MSNAQMWTIIIAVLVILAVSVTLTLTYLRRVVDRRFDALGEHLTLWFSANDRRQETLELQRASIETRLASIEVRLNTVDTVDALIEVDDSIDPLG